MMSEDSSAAGTNNRPPMLEESDYESWKIRIEEYTTPYNQYLATKESQDVPTEASPIPPTAAYILQTLTDVTTQVEGHRKVNQEQALVNATLSAELDQCKLELARLERNKVKLECDQVIVARNKRNAKLEQETELLKTTLRNKEATIASLTSETKTVLSEKKTLEDKYLEEIVCLKNANQVATGLFPQKELSREQVYWISASNIASQSSDPPKPMTPFVHTRPVNSEVKFQKFKFKECANSNATPLNAIFEINKLKDQLQERDKTIRNLKSQFNISRMLKIGSPVELSKASTYSCNTSNEKIAALNDEIAKMKPSGSGTKVSRPKTPDKPKVVASGMYTKSSKYIPPQKRTDWVQPTLLPKKKQVTFLEPHRTSPRSTQKPPVQHKKPTISVNMFPKAKPAIEARKPIPKGNTQNHNPLPAKSVKARRAADYYRNLYVDISQFVDRSMKSVHAKPHQEKRVVNTSTNSWNATKNTVTRIVPIWKPTGRRFNLHDIFGSRMSMKPIVKPSELTPCVSPSTNATLSLEPILEPVELSSSVSSYASSTITMISRFSDYKLSDRKAGSNGISSIFY
nr:hypothetical protein [Tanacetum cinerariifolium]